MLDTYNHKQMDTKINTVSKPTFSKSMSADVQITQAVSS